ncbi:hypothetical protein HBB16_11785 [Pseudonocardia sp. MCCB 268]|nr:hypothetical protein [Pseudonocardia cytotoxica]
MNAGWRTLSRRSTGRFLLGVGGGAHRSVVGERSSGPVRRVRTGRWSETTSATGWTTPPSWQAPPAAPEPCAGRPRAADAAARRRKRNARCAHLLRAGRAREGGPRRAELATRSPAPAQTVVLQDGPRGARRIAQGSCRCTSRCPNYTESLRRLGWGDDDLAGEGASGLVDTIVAWGPSTGSDRVQAPPHDAGPRPCRSGAVDVGRACHDAELARKLASIATSLRRPRSSRPRPRPEQRLIQLTVATTYLARLADSAHQSIFMNAGPTSHRSSRAYAVNKEEGGPTLPNPVLCAHQELSRVGWPTVPRWCPEPAAGV